MDYTKTMQALKWLMVETESLACLGCEHKDQCATHGCAILRNAVEHMEAALANYDHLSALVDQQEANFKLCNKYLTDSEEARSALARQLAAARKQVDELLRNECTQPDSIDDTETPEWKRRFMRTFLGGR